MPYALQLMVADNRLSDRDSLRVVMETTSLSRPGQERGLGRYTRACLSGARTLGHDVTELQLRSRKGRLAEFRDLVERTARATCLAHDLIHIPHPHVWGASGRPAVVSILDTIPIDMPAYQQTGLKARFFFQRAVKADVVLTISKFTASRLTAIYGLEPSKIHVAPLYPDVVFYTGASSSRPARLDGDYVLALVDMATPDPRKRPGWITPLARDLKRTGLTLVLAGAGTDQASADIGEAIGLGRITDTQLAQLAHHCVCFLYFSAYEGQGLPPLEAMAAGAAIVATANTAIIEIVGDAGLLITEDMEDWKRKTPAEDAAEATRKELVDACVLLARDDSLRTDLRTKGRMQASLFSEQRFIQELDRAYREAACR